VSLSCFALEACKEVIELLLQVLYKHGAPAMHHVYTQVIHYCQYSPMYCRYKIGSTFSLYVAGIFTSRHISPVRKTILHKPVVPMAFQDSRGIFWE
jgi:hypothetical protein